MALQHFGTFNYKKLIGKSAHSFFIGITARLSQETT
jgi:hypothetical protein